MRSHATAVPQRAATVAARAPGTMLLQRKCACSTHTASAGQCDSCHDKLLQRKSVGAGAAFQIPPIVGRVLAESGQPMDPPTRGFMESRFGSDFSGVRVHTDPAAGRSASAVGALAYTVGKHVVFGAGRYAPASESGRYLLAHELAHTLQQGASASTVSPRLAGGAAETAAEIEADRAADRVLGGGSPPTLTSFDGLVLRRQRVPDLDLEAEPNFDSPQPRGGRPRSTILDAGRRGDDEVRVAVTRYLCACSGRDVSRTSASARLQPRPGVTLEFCSGRDTIRISGEVEPSTISTGRATVRGEYNRAPGAGGIGVNVGVEGEVRNTGREPQGGGGVDLRVGRPGGPQFGGRGRVLRGTETGTTDVEIGVGADFGGRRVGVDVTNPQDNRRGIMVTFGGDLPGQAVRNQQCRVCRCPVVYECLEDIPPRDYQEAVPYEVEQRGRLRYYFSLDTNQDTRDPTLRAESGRMLDEVARRVGAGERIVSVRGYASPEDNRERPTPNERLSLTRAQRLRGLLAARLGPDARLPAPAAGGELLGRVATIAPGSRLADAILQTGFGDAEDVSSFMIGDDITNPQLADQFLQLLHRVTEPADRLRLFGVDTSSPAAPRLLASIQQFIRNRGRGRRPWEGIFGYLRYATVELAETQQRIRMEDRRTSGSLRPLPDAQCTPWAKGAERQVRFGPAAPEPESAGKCPTGGQRNPARFAARCNH